MSVITFADRERVLVGAPQLDEVAAMAEATPRRRARICLHDGADDPVQQMLISLCADSYVPPHRQPGRCESFVLLRGAVAVVFYQEQRIDRVVRLSAEGPEPFAFWFSADGWHTVVGLAPMNVYLETVPGPFTSDSNLLAPWAPGLDDPAGGDWLARLRATL